MSFEDNWSLEKKEKPKKLRLLEEHSRGKRPAIHAGTIGEIRPANRVVPINGHTAAYFEGYGTYYIDDNYWESVKEEQTDNDKKESL